MTTTSSKMSFSDKFRTWKNDDAPSSSRNQNQNQPSSNPFARQDRRDKYAAAASASVSYAEHKRKKEEEAKEKEKNRPLTADDFPALGGMATVAVVKPKGDPNRSSLAAHLAATMKKDEEDAIRRRIEREEEEEKRRREDGFVRLPLYTSPQAYFKAKREQAEAQAASAVPPMEPPRVTLPPLKMKYTRPSMLDDGEYDDYVEEDYTIEESFEEENYGSQQDESEMR